MLFLEGIFMIPSNLQTHEEKAEYQRLREKTNKSSYNGREFGIMNEGQPLKVPNIFEKSTTNTKKKNRFSLNLSQGKREKETALQNDRVLRGAVSSSVLCCKILEDKDRVIYTQQLRMIWEVFSTLGNGQVVKLKWVPEKRLIIRTADKCSLNETKAVLAHINHVLSEVQKNNIKQFYDDEGQKVSIQVLFKTIKRSFLEKEKLSNLYTACKFDLLESSIDRITTLGLDVDPIVKELSLLPLPFPEGIKEEEICVQFLQRMMYIGKESSEEFLNLGIISPLTLLCTYRRFFSTDILFKQIESLLKFSLDFMPLQQKIMIVEFCRLWVSSGLNHIEAMDEVVAKLLMAIIHEAESTKNSMLVDCSNEIRSMLYEAPFKLLSVRKADHPKKIKDILKILDIKGAVQKKDYENSLNYLVGDLHSLSIHYFLSFEAHELMADLNKESGIKTASRFYAVTKFYEQVYYFIIQSILSPIIKFNELDISKENYKIEREKILQRTKLLHRYFVDIAEKMLVLNDFPMVMTILGALQGVCVDKFYSEAMKKLPKKNTDKLNELRVLFDSNYKVLKDKCKDLKCKGELYIPYAVLIKQAIARIEELCPNNIDDISDNKINIEKLNYLSDQLVPFYTMQKKWAELLKERNQGLKMSTDIEFALKSTQDYDEDKYITILNNFL